MKLMQAGQTYLVLGGGIAEDSAPTRAQYTIEKHDPMFSTVTFAFWEHFLVGEINRDWFQRQEAQR
jgi:hypothetical protein